MARLTGKRWYGVDLLTWACLAHNAFDAREFVGYEEALMPVDPELLELYVDSVDIEPFQGEDFDNVTSYGAAVPYRAKIDAKTEEVLKKTGDIALSTHSVALDDVYPIDERDRITMPARFRISNPVIAAVKEWTDETGPHHTTVKVGVRKRRKGREV